MKNTLKDRQRIQKKWKKSKIRISKELRDIIHGYVMSDGFIRNGTLTVEQGQKQKRFVHWLYQKLESIRTPGPIQQVTRVHPQTKRLSYSLRFFTRALLQGFHHMWYKPCLNAKHIPESTLESGVTKYQKKLPQTLSCFFNETFITIWYAGDGTKIKGSLGAKFEVTSLTVEERLKLKDLFFKKFAISTRILKAGISRKGNSQWVLKIIAEDYPKFQALITKMDLIPTLFPYKLHKKT